MGAHQKLDRIARRALEQLAPDSDFPSIKEILHFEGKNGPDGIKSKSPAQDEPWHYYDPTDPGDTKLIYMIERHSKNLSVALKKGQREKAAFEAAWQAHAIADGLTPAHHFPFAQRLEELRGAGMETRNSIREKLIIKSEGDSGAEMLAKNWEMWGAKGLMTTHGLFEWGVATTIAPLRLKSGYPTQADCRQVQKEGVIPAFKEAAQQILALNMYDRFSHKGWTSKLANDTKKVLAPAIVRVIVLAWYEALARVQEK